MRTIIVAAILFSCVACSNEEQKPPAPAEVSVQSAHTAVVTSRPITTGPRLSGTLQPQQSATLLAETGGTVSAVRAAEGQSVAAGTVVARISDESANDALRSAQVAVQSGQTAVAMATRDFERTQRLASAGALATRDVEVARSQLSTAEAQLAQSRAQLAAAAKRVNDQNVVASTAGIISEKAVSAGDVVTPGTVLFRIIDLGTLQLEANVPADALEQISVGTPVELNVRGHSETFTGTLTRVSPAVDPATGQLQVYVSVPNQGRRLVAGLFAEGRVRNVAHVGFTIPIDALDESGASPVVTRVRNGVTERVTVRLGVRDEQEGWVEVVSGLNEGDTILVGPSRTIPPGTRVNVS